MDKKKINKLVILPSELDDESGFDLSLNENLVFCRDCNSNLIYVQKIYGVVAEDNYYQVLGNKDKLTYAIREVGFNYFCAECGVFNEHYCTWFYPEEKLVMVLDEIKNVEIVEIQHCLNQFNQKKDFNPLYKFSDLDKLKEKLKEYEKNRK